MKALYISLLMLSLLFKSNLTYSCTIFYVAKDNKVFAGNNEDWEDPYSKIYFYPPENHHHGWIKFGWGSGFPQGGMNDQGLFWDGSSGPYLAMPLSEANKEKYPTALMQKVIEECSNIEEARGIFDRYYCEDQYKAQYLVGDSLGNSIIVEGDNIYSEDRDYLVLTNFYNSHPELGGYPCWRHETATNMLSSYTELSPYFVGSVLASTHQEGRYPTQYSNIYDLKNCTIYLFHFHNYEEFIIIDLVEELKKGYRSVDIPELFSKINLLTPSDGEKIESTSVTISWEGMPGSSYEVIYSSESEFLEANSISQTYISSDISNHSWLMFFMPGLLFIIPCVNRKKSIYLPIIILFTGLFSFQCQKEQITDPEVEVIEIKETIVNLLPETTYYWKIRAHSEGQDDFYSETITRNFITEKK
ncbi:MAG: hypothetical protein KAS71_14700 [Bacteroidales bacterium]|nr:hypothetical protein [Bacteroidales bacterium]